MNVQHFLTKFEKVIIYSPKNGFIELFGHLYKTINSSAASVSVHSSIDECFSTKVITRNAQFIKVVLFTYTKFNNKINNTVKYLTNLVVFNIIIDINLTQDTFNKEQINFSNKTKPWFV